PLTFGLALVLVLTCIPSIAEAKFKLKLKSVITKTLGIPKCQGFEECLKKNVLPAVVPSVALVRVPVIKRAICKTTRKCKGFEDCTELVFDCLEGKVTNPNPNPTNGDPGSGPSRTDEPIPIRLTVDKDACNVPCIVAITAEVTSSADLSWSGCYAHPEPTSLT